MNIHTNAKIKQFLLNVVLILLAFTIQNCVFPLLPFLAATPNLLLILTFSFGFIHGKGAGMLYGVLSGLLLDLFYSGPFGFYTLAYIYIGYINGIFTRYYYEDYITLPLILSVFNELAYSCLLYTSPPIWSGSCLAARRSRKTSQRTASYRRTWHRRS